MGVPGFVWVRMSFSSRVSIGRHSTAAGATDMRVVDAVADILKREGTEFLLAYPRNPIIEACAQADIRPIIVRQERVGLHMAEAVSRLTSGTRIGVFAMQQGPGTENAFGGVAQAFGDSAPILVLPAGYARGSRVEPNFNAFLN